MSTGELITSFRLEVQQMILSNQEKFNPDKNELIDATEIGVLLKEYGATQASELQKSKGVFAKINDYVFPDVDVYPSIGDGYRIQYTDGDESHLTASGAERIIAHGIDNSFSMLGGFLFSASSGIAGLVGFTDFASELAHNGKKGFKTPKGRGALFTMLGATVLGFIAKKCFNSARNDDTIARKVTMCEQDRRIQAERRAREEELRRQEEAMKAAELEYRERMNNATAGIERSLDASRAKTGKLNRQLNVVNAQVDSLVNKTN